ncbi:hypothetical protein [Streptomyces antarcticus]|uniref:hypothetical protein n=1 Tax=Streptomyces antarcticus TaxID=2996458 RepID=UPI002271CB0A|nr:hypothetical protein [Streptomyces sp. H34-AA3]MCY0945689.1 hypothetical protein [Streptomyces sp. H34-AA3]
MSSHTIVRYEPAPGTEYPFAISDIARQAVKHLDEAWQAESGYWGVVGEITAPDATRFVVGVDHEGDLYVHSDKNADPTFVFEHFDIVISASDGLEEVTKYVVALILDLA